MTSIGRSGFAGRLLELATAITLAGGCAGTGPPPVAVVPSDTAAPSFTPSPVPPTSTQPPSPTATVTASPTPLPGKLVMPLDSLANHIPWLPPDPSAGPTVMYVAFNTAKPPFNNALVRCAFAHAVDRQVVADMAARYRVHNPVPATNLTPPEILGRDVYNVIGAGFTPETAKALLTEAGYTDPSAFPSATFIVGSHGETAPGARFNFASAMADMWKTHLGVTVNVGAIGGFYAYGDRLRSDPPDLYMIAWVADFNDPHNFLSGIFRSDSSYNYGHYANPAYDRILDKAATAVYPAERQLLYLVAERLLTETDCAVIPLYHYTIP